MGWFHDSIWARAILTVSVIILMGLVIDAVIDDRKCASELKHNQAVWRVPDISEYQQVRINMMIDNYFRRRSLNKSSYKKIIVSAKEGAVRGAIGGCITGGPTGIIPGAIIYGVLGAASTGFKRKRLWDDQIVASIRKF